LADFDLFCLANTVLDTGINVFLFERQDGLLPQASKYLSKQAARVESGLDELEKRKLPTDLPKNDAALRVGCLLAWGRFRKRFNLEGRAKLRAFLHECDSYGPFSDTAPPAGA
jgi:glutathione S-transferase